jgi:hypothetical protein
MEQETESILEGFIWTLFAIFGVCFFIVKFLQWIIPN